MKKTIFIIASIILLLFLALTDYLWLPIRVIVGFGLLIYVFSEFSESIWLPLGIAGSIGFLLVLINTGLWLPMLIMIGVTAVGWFIIWFIAESNWLWLLMAGKSRRRARQKRQTPFVL